MFRLLSQYVRTSGSNRFATIFFYLSDVEEGGETVKEDISR
jgi:hypothetical protein